MNDSVLLVEERKDVVLLTLNRPDKRNALNKALRDALLSAVDNYKEQKKAIIITGMGKAYCAGLDLKENPDINALKEFWSLCQRIQSSNCLFIAAVNGIAIGGGLIIVNSCDIVIGAPHSRYGMPSVDLEKFPILSDPLSRLKNSANGQPWKDITGKLIDAGKALDQGLINHVAENGAYVQDAWSIAEQICQFDKLSLVNAKKKTIQHMGADISQPELMELGKRKSRDVRNWL